MQIDSAHLDALHCPGCGYNLFGIEASIACPECGLAIDRTNIGISRIPWTHRRKIGRVRAFYKTTQLVVLLPNILFPKRLAEELNRPVSFEDAGRFRLICILLAWIPCTAGIVIFVATNARDYGLNSRECVVASIIEAATMWLLLLSITALPAFFLRPKNLSVLRQNRAVALSYYIAAPLAGLIVVGPCAVLGGLLSRVPERNLGLTTFIGVPASVVTLLLLPILLIALANGAATLVRQATGCGSIKRWTLFFCLPIVWLFLACIFLIVIPMAIFFAAIVVESSR